jgi:hypothetical protein
VGFKPVEPLSFGKPTRVYSSGSTEGPGGPELGVEFLFDDPNLGRFVLAEEATTQAPSTIADFVQTASTYEGAIARPELFSAIDSPAYIIASADETSVAFIRGGIRFDLRGPTKSFTRDVAESVANTVARDVDKSGVSNPSG